MIVIIDQITHGYGQASLGSVLTWILLVHSKEEYTCWLLTHIQNGQKSSTWEVQQPVEQLRKLCFPYMDYLKTDSNIQCGPQIYVRGIKVYHIPFIAERLVQTFKNAMRASEHDGRTHSQWLASSFYLTKVLHTQLHMKCLVNCFLRGS